MKRGMGKMGVASAVFFHFQFNIFLKHIFLKLDGGGAHL